MTDTMPSGPLAAGVLRSIAQRFGFVDERQALAELGVLNPRSTARYSGAEILPIARWQELDRALRCHDPERAEVLLADGALVEMGAILHQRVDLAEARFPGESSRSIRRPAPATAGQVNEVGDRLLAGEQLGIDDTLLVPRFVREHTARGRLRSKGIDAVGRLWEGRRATPKPSSHYSDIALKEALRNLDAGPATAAALTVIADTAAVDTCPCDAAVMLPLLISDRVEPLIVRFFDSHDWESHQGVLHAAHVLRIPDAIGHLADLPDLCHKTCEFADRYLTSILQNARLDPRGQRVAAELHEHGRYRVGGYTRADRTTVEQVVLRDRVGTTLSEDPVIPHLWHRMLLAEDSAEADTALRLVHGLGLVAEESVAALVADTTLSLRLRVSALTALAAFATALSEPLLRRTASDRALPVELRFRALCSYRAHGADASWLFTLLADPDPRIRQAALLPARHDCPALVAAATQDPEPSVARRAIAEARRLEAAGRLGPLTVLPPTPRSSPMLGSAATA